MATARPPCGCANRRGPTAGATAAKIVSHARREEPRATFARIVNDGGCGMRQERMERQIGRPRTGVKRERAREGAINASDCGRRIGGSCSNSGSSSSNSSDSRSWRGRTTHSRQSQGRGFHQTEDGARSSRRGGDIATLPCFPLPSSLVGGGGGRKRVSWGIESATKACISSRFAAAMTAAFALLAAASAQGGGGESAAVAAEPVVVPLTPAGLQYTAEVVLTNATSSSTAALIVDTMVSIVAFSACADGAAGGGGGAAGDGENSTCILSRAHTEGVKWNCRTRAMDGGTVTLHPENLQNFTYFPDQEVSLARNVSAVGDVLAVFNITTTGYSGTLSGWEGAGGVLGLARFPRRQCLRDETVVGSDRSIFSKINGVETFFALDLGNENYSSTLEIGSYNGALSEDVGGIEWGETQTAAFPSSWGFSAFDLSVCGRSLMGNVTSFWPAAVSTGSACLGLPAEFFDSLMAWLPIKQGCTAAADGEGAMCSLTSEDAAKELPSLSFRLSQNGRQFYVPLSSLLLEATVTQEGEGMPAPDGTPGGGGTDGSGDRRLCVTRHASIRDPSWLFELPSAQPVVSFGTLPLRSLYTVVDTAIGRVGLAQKGEGAVVSLRESSNTSCQPAQECVGMQTFEESKNSCQIPACSSYFFTRLDEETMTCKSTGVMTTLVWVFGIIFGVTEMAVHFLRAYYGATGVGVRGQQHLQGWEFHTGRLLETFVGKATRALGRSSHERSD